MDQEDCTSAASSTSSPASSSSGARLNGASTRAQGKCLLLASYSNQGRQLYASNANKTMQKRALGQQQQRRSILALNRTATTSRTGASESTANRPKFIKANTLSHLQARDKKKKQQQRKRHELGPIDLEGSREAHRQAHALDKQYFLGAATRTIGRRATRWMSQIDVDPFSQSAARVATLKRPRKPSQLEPAGWMSDSCDSDKSCSPGANRNNFYNISHAHRAYQSGGHIHPGMFLSTQFNGDLLKEQATLSFNQPRRQHLSASLQQLPRGQSASGLLKAMEVRLQQPVGASSQWVVDEQDEGQKVERGHQRRPSTFQPENQQQQPSLVRIDSNWQSDSQQQQTTTMTAGYSNDLLPISAEEEWPEPYMDHEANREENYVLEEQELRPENGGVPGSRSFRGQQQFGQHLGASLGAGSFGQHPSDRGPSSGHFRRPPEGQ